MLTIKGEFETYAAIEQLQTCLLGEVMIGVGMFTGSVVAIKSIRPDVKTDLPETPLAEVCFSPYLRGNPLFVQVIEVVHQDGFHYVVSEYVNGDDLLELLKQYPGGIEESIVSVIVRIICEAILACHDRGIALQDFSLENCLLWIKDTEGACSVKLCDPGQACLFRDRNKPQVKHCGMVGKRFRPPEIFKVSESYDPTLVDAWCLGWSVWYLLFATPIFEVVTPEAGGSHQIDSEPDERFLLFRSGDIDGLMRKCGIDSKQCSNEAIDFILKLVTINPEDRMSIGQAMLHPFIQKSVNSPLTLYNLPLPVEASDYSGTMRHTLRMLSMLQGLERYRMFRFLLYQHKEMADCFRQVWSSEFAAREQRDALRQSHTTSRRKPKKYDSLGCPMAQGEAKALRVAEKLKKYAPYTPKYYREELIPLLCCPSKPSSTLIRPNVEQPTVEALKIRTLPSIISSAGNYAAARPLLSQSTMLSTSTRATPSNRLAVNTISGCGTAQQQALTTFINPVYKQHSFLQETAAAQSAHAGTSARSTPRLTRRGGSNCRVIDGAVAAKREVHTVATTSLLQHNANGSKFIADSSKSFTGRSAGCGSAKFKPAIVNAQRPLMTQTSISQEAHSRISAAGRFLDLEEPAGARGSRHDTQTLTNDDRSIRPFALGISPSSSINHSGGLSRIQQQHHQDNPLNSYLSSNNTKKPRPTPLTLSRDAPRHSLSSNWVGGVTKVSPACVAPWQQSNVNDITSWHQRGAAVKH